jgi:heterodisulfide reductase subunit C2
MDICVSAAAVESDIIRKIEKISGEKLANCYNCGKCSAGCPVVGEMDILPNQVIRLLQLGQVDEVKDSKTVWICASCFQCGERCPRGVDVSKVAEAVRLLVLRKNVDRIDINKIPVEQLMELPQIAIISAMRKYTG